MMRGSERDGLVAVVGSAMLGLGYMAAADAPIRYLSLNAIALAIGLAAFVAIRRAPWRVDVGLVAVMIGAILLATAIFGVRVEGASRWMFVGGLSIQPSLILLPALCVLVAQTRAKVLAAVVLASVAMALQPDRAMAAALTAAMLALAIVRRDRHGAALFAIAAIGFAVTLARPDTLPAVPFVDRILFTGFEISPVAGLALWTGAALLLLPAISGELSARVHGATWAAIVGAAALGNYPTPVVGYGSSAIIGYLLALAALPSPSRRRTTADPLGNVPARKPTGELRIAH